MKIIELELDLKNFFFGWQVLDLVVIFFFYKKEVEDLHESFPGFAFLILIFFLTWKDCSIFWNLECPCFDSAIQQVSVYICGSVTYHLYR